jgi:hypothetical protein
MKFQTDTMLLTGTETAGWVWVISLLMEADQEINLGLTLLQLVTRGQKSYAGKTAMEMVSPTDKSLVTHIASGKKTKRPPRQKSRTLVSPTIALLIST